MQSGNLTKSASKIPRKASEIMLVGKTTKPLPGPLKNYLIVIESMNGAFENPSLYKINRIKNKYI